MPRPTTRNLAVLITDIKGFTDKTSRRSRADLRALLEEHTRIVLPVLEGHGGKLIKTMGDAFLMVFDSPTDAVLAGVAVQERLAKYNENLQVDDRIEIRVAISAGEVNIQDKDIFGDPVNIAARIQAISKPGEVFFSEAVYLAMNKSEVPSIEIGLLQLKGIPEKVRVYKVRRQNPVSARTGPAKPTRGKSSKPMEPISMKRSILVIDDEEEVRLLVRNIFAKEGHSVIEAKDGHQALSTLRELAHPPDLIILDIQMAGMDGIEFLHRYRADKSFARVPVVVLTSKGGQGWKAALGELGADAFLSKPLLTNELQACVRGFLLPGLS